MVTNIVDAEYYISESTSKILAKMLVSLCWFLFLRILYEIVLFRGLPFIKARGKGSVGKNLKL